jgi:hypothetical protein
MKTQSNIDEVIRDEIEGNFKLDENNGQVLLNRAPVAYQSDSAEQTKDPQQKISL